MSIKIQFGHPDKEIRNAIGSPPSSSQFTHYNIDEKQVTRRPLHQKV